MNRAEFEYIEYILHAALGHRTLHSGHAASAATAPAGWQQMVRAALRICGRNIYILYARMRGGRVVEFCKLSGEPTKSLIGIGHEQ